MGFMSVLGKAAPIAGYVAAPFTGGASIPIGMAVGRMASGAAQGSADQRMAENTSAAQRNALLAQLYGIQQNASQNALAGQSREQSDHASIDLDRKKFALAAPSARASQSVRGSILQNAQPASVSGLPSRIQSNIPQISGGLSPALFNDQTRELGGELTRQALLDQLKGDEFAPLERTDFQSGRLAPPELEEFQRAGTLEKIMGGTGLIASIIGALGEARNGTGRPDEDEYDENESGGY